MNDFIILIGELFLIICIESVIEIFISDRRNRYMQKLLSIACYCGGLYIVLKFAFNYLFKEIYTIIRLYF